MVVSRFPKATILLLSTVLLLSGVLWTGCATQKSPSSVAPPGPPEKETPAGKKAYAQKHFIRGLTQARLGDHAAAIHQYEQALQAAPGRAAILSAMAEAQAAQEAAQEADQAPNANLAAAIYYAKLAHKSAPDNPFYHRQLAHLYRQDGNLEQAIATYSAFVEHFPDDFKAHFSLAHLQTEAGRYDEALSTYQALTKRIGDRSEVYLEMLEVYRRTGDTSGIERTLQTLVELRPDQNRYRRSLSTFYRGQDQSQAAISVLQEALQRDPDDAQAATMLADLYRTTGRKRKADALTDRTLDTDDASAGELVARALSLYRSPGRDSGATRTTVQLLRQALKKDSSNTDAQQMLGTLRYQRGEYSEAADLLTSSLEKNPRDPKRWFQAAAAHLQADRPRRAAEVADEGLILFPGELPLLRISARALMASNRNEAAIARFQEALRLLEEEKAEPEAQTRSLLLAALGLLYSREGNTRQSDRYYRQAINADPGNAPALNNFAYSLAERGTRLRQALKMARRAVDHQPQNASFLDTLGWVYFKLEQFDKAKKYFQKAFDTGEASATVYKHRGDVDAARGNAQSARHYWQEALNRGLDSERLRKKLNETPE